MSGNSSNTNVVHCADSLDGLFISTAYMITKTILLLPLCILVLHLGLQQWRRQRSFATTSHSDIFTFHMVALELISAVGGTIYFCGSYTNTSEVIRVGFHISYIVLPGQMFFHSLTCIERYLAVVHPVLYLRLRQSGGVKIRNISTVCVWLISLVWSGAMVLWISELPFGYLLCLVIISLTVLCFCSLRVLCVLIRPGPGEVGRDRADQSKQRAFNTIMAIMAVLWLWFAAILVALVLDSSKLLAQSASCVVLTSANWFSLPSSLVLPLLFLHRAGKPVCCC